MKKPVEKDFNLKSFKITKDGGAEIHFSFLVPVGSEAHLHSYKPFTCETYIQEEIINILDSQKPNIMKVEGIRYRQMAEALRNQGVDSSEIVTQIAEDMTIKSMENIVVTGISISGMDDKKSVKIIYKRYHENKRITGHTTCDIMLSALFYGFEQDLEDDLNELIKEVYAYVYKGKHAGSSQLTLPIWDSEEDPEGNEPEESGEEKTEED